MGLDVAALSCPREHLYDDVNRHLRDDRRADFDGHIGSQIERRQRLWPCDAVRLKPFALLKGHDRAFSGRPKIAVNAAGIESQAFEPLLQLADRRARVSMP